MIELVRLDERLIHGQVAAKWCKILPIDSLVVLDDNSAKNRTLMGTLFMAAPADKKTIIKTVDEGISILNDPRAKNLHIMVVVKHIKDLKKVLEACKDDIKEANVSNYGRIVPSAKPRKAYGKHMDLNDEERDMLLECTDIVPMYMQMQPETEKIDLKKLLAK